MIKSPCKRDCPKRSATCKKTCLEWKDYETEHLSELEEKAKLAKCESAYQDYMASVKTRSMQAQVRERKRGNVKVKDSRKGVR